MSQKTELFKNQNLLIYQNNLNKFDSTIGRSVEDNQKGGWSEYARRTLIMKLTLMMM
jgi:hypothetical protein